MIQLALIFKEQAPEEVPEPIVVKKRAKVVEPEEDDDEEVPRRPTPQPESEEVVVEPEKFVQESLDDFTVKYATADEWLTALEVALKSGVHFSPESFACGVRIDDNVFADGHHMQETVARRLFKETKKGTLVIDVSAWFIWYWPDDPRGEYRKPHFIEIETK
jgi:hypothetical protein